MSQDSVHIPVLLKESIDYLKASSENYHTFLDCTAGGGGHSKQILDSKDTNIVYSMDRDVKAIERLNSKFADYKERSKIIHSSFGKIMKNIDQKFDGILADLGISSDQLAEDRGFSFSDSNLDMRMDTSNSTKTAKEIINNYNFNSLYRIFKIGGIKKEASKLVKFIIENRNFNTAEELKEAVTRFYTTNKWTKKTNPATLVFQSLRIEVNGEFAEIKALLNQIPQIINKKGRVVIISFHSSEDKLIASTFRQWQNGDSLPPGWGTPEKKRLGNMITSKAVVPTLEEIESNPRSRSSLMRIFEFF